MPRSLRRAAVLGTTAKVASNRGAAQATAAQQQAAPIAAAPVAPPVAAAPVEPPVAAPVAAPVPTDSYAELTKLKELFDAGILTQDEFDAEKKKVLSA